MISVSVSLEIKAVSHSQVEQAGPARDVVVGGPEVRLSIEHLLGDQALAILPNSRFAKLPSLAIDWKIWKALYSHGCLFVWLFVTLLTF